MKVARYKPQGYFKLHTDHVEAFNSLCCGGRLGTLIVYLNDDFEGGHTEFPTIGVSVEPCAGDAIYFHSVQVGTLKAGFYVGWTLRIQDRPSEIQL